MSAVYVNNLVVNSGSDFSQSFTLEGTFTNTPLDLNGYTVASQMRKWAGSSNYTDFNASIEYPASSGRVLIGLTSEETSNLKPGRYVYDVIITDQYDVKYKVVEGMVLVREGVTR